MPTTKELLLELTYEDGNLAKKVKTSTDALSGQEKASNNVQKSFNTVKLAAVTMAAVVTTKVISALQSSIKYAINANEIFSKFNVTFGTVSKEANKSASELSNSFGISSVSAKELLSNTADLLQGFGLTQKGSLDLSTQVQKLAIDLASFTNYSGGASGASEALTKALLGERESVKALGIAILEQDVLKQMQIDSANGMSFATEKEAKAYATLQIALSQSKNAIGDYARTSDSLANVSRTLGERLKEISLTIGNALLPFVSSLAKRTLDLVNKFNGLNTGTKVFSGLMAAIIPIAASVGISLSSAFGPAGLIIGGISLALGAITAKMAAARAEAAALVSELTTEEALKRQADILREVNKLRNQGAEKHRKEIRALQDEWGLLDKRIKQIAQDEAFAAKQAASERAMILEQEKQNRIENEKKKKDELKKIQEEYTDFITNTEKEQFNKRIKDIEDEKNKLIESKAFEKEQIEEIEKSAQQRIDKIKEEYANKDKEKAENESKEKKQIAEQTVNKLMELYNVLDQLQNTLFENEIARIEAERDAKLDSLQDEYEATLYNLENNSEAALELQRINEEEDAARKAAREQDLADAIASGDTEKAAAIQREIDKEAATEKLRLQKEKAEKKYLKDKEKAERDYNKKIAKMKRDQAIVDKIVSLFDIAARTAASIAGAVAASPGTGGLPFSAINAGIGAAQAAIVAAQPLPEIPTFAQGGMIRDVLPASGIGSDDGLIAAQRGESVLTREATAVLGEDAINALNSGRGGLSNNVNISVNGGNTRDIINALNSYFRLYGTSQRGVAI